MSAESIVGCAVLVGETVFGRAPGCTHADILALLPAGIEHEKGILTLDGAFVDEQEAYIMALRAGQVQARAEKMLTSEDLR